MKSARILFSVALVVASCDSSVTLSSRNLDCGDGVTTTLSPDGELFVFRNGIKIVGTDPKSPLFSRVVDADNPTGFHNVRDLHGE